jgi:hypothetical protein
LAKILKRLVKNENVNFRVSGKYATILSMMISNWLRN